MSTWKKWVTSLALLSAVTITACGTDSATPSTPAEKPDDPTDRDMDPDPDPDPDPPDNTPMNMDPMEPTEGSRLALKAYDPCEEDEDCEEGLSCVDLLGSQVCSVVGCGDDESLCVEGETCVVSPTIAPDGVCAFSGTDQFCARHCRDPLVCNLDIECTTRGCCGAVGQDGCPTQCADLDPMNCEISPQCPASCCGD